MAEKCQEKISKKENLCYPAKKYLYFLIKSTGTEIYFYVIISNSIPIKH